jgi:hypothetical protein
MPPDGRVQSLDFPRGICDRKSGTETGFPEYFRLHLFIIPPKFHTQIPLTYHLDFLNRFIAQKIITYIGL